MSTACTIKL